MSSDGGLRDEVGDAEGAQCLRHPQAAQSLQEDRWHGVARAFRDG